MSKKRCWLWSGAGILLVIAAMAYQLLTPWGVSSRAKQYLGTRTATILAGATRVETYRLKSREQRMKGETLINGYPVMSTGQVQGKQFASALARIVFDEKLFTSNGMTGKLCFDPGVAFRVWRGNEWVWVVICYKCNNLRISGPGLTGRKYGGVYEDIDLSRPALVKLAKQVFPKDKEIQSLKEIE